MFILEKFEHVWAMWICVGELHAEATTLSWKWSILRGTRRGSRKIMPRTKMVDTELRVWRPVRSYTSHLPAEQKRGWTSRICVWRGAKCMWKLAAWVTKQVYVTGLCPNLNNWPTPFIYEDGNFFHSILAVLLYLKEPPSIKAGCKRWVEHHFGGAGGIRVSQKKPLVEWGWWT